ncbi:MAG TPA: hypothetical protein EYH22_01760 [Candidatus Nanopusillus sp.]|nr:hypothetical protein [Candidatus Nanopusillus sp.]
MDKVKKIVLSLGGSLLYKNGSLDIQYIKSFTNLIKEYYAKGYWFGIVVGGGYIARSFQEQLKKYLDARGLDWVGIRATHLNAEILRQLLRDIAFDNIITDYRNIPKTDKILVGGGWLPGSSTDYDTVYLAYRTGVRVVINLSNVDGILIDGRIIEKVSYNQLLRIVPEWKPGLHFPIDKKALLFAKERKMTFIHINGRNLDNFRNLLDGKDFIGTVVSDSYGM